MIVVAPASRAAAITWSPTPPQPITATRSPMRTRAAWATAPKPVMTPQPSSAACHSATSSGIGMAPAAATTAYWAKQATGSACCSRPPSAPRRRELPSGRLPATDWRPTGSQSVRRPDRHASHRPHEATMQNTT